MHLKVGSNPSRCDKVHERVAPQTMATEPPARDKTTGSIAELNNLASGFRRQLRKQHRHDGGIGNGLSQADDNQQQHINTRFSLVARVARVMKRLQSLPSYCFLSIGSQLPKRCCESGPRFAMLL